jgi:hypothetical protein
MRHTSIRLSERHLELIESTGKSPTKVMREALDLYFKTKPEEGSLDRMKALIQEHERTWHKSEHKESTPEPPPGSVSQNVKKSAQRAQSVLTKEAQGSKDVPQSVRKDEAQRAQSVPQDVREDPLTLAKRFILAELEAGREPAAAEVAEHVGMKSRPLGVLMSKAGLQARLTGTGNNKVRRYTFELREKIKGGLKG